MKERPSRKRKQQGQRPRRKGAGCGGKEQAAGFCRGLCREGDKKELVI